MAGFHFVMQFRDFNIEILAKRDDLFDVRVVSGASGELQATITLQRSVDDVLQALQAHGIHVRGATGERDFTPPEHTVARPSTAIGQELFDLLFSSPEVTRALAECMTDAKNSDAGVRLKLTLNTKDAAVADLARLPWELLHDDTKYKYFSLRPDSPIVRYLEVPKPFVVKPFRPPLRILVVSSNPRNDLALDKERDNLKAALGDDPNIELTFVEGATIQTIAGALARGKATGRDFHVLHYMGHGDFHNGKGALLLHKDGGGEDFVDADAFNTALQAAEDIRLVFLNSCNTAQSSAEAGSNPFAGVATALVFEGVPAVVAMQRPVPDNAAIVLAKNFYPNIARGWPVDAAVSEGRRQMFFANRDSLDWAIPVLFMRSPNGALFDFAETSAPAVAMPPPQPVAARVDAERPAAPESQRVAGLRPVATASNAPPSRMRMMAVGAALAVAALITLVVFLPDAPAPEGQPAAGAPAAAPGTTPAAEPVPIDEEQVRALQARAGKDPQDAESRMELGITFSDANRFAEAIPWFEQALALRPKDLDLSSELARTYDLAHQPERAEKQFAAALAIDPQHPKTLAYKGMFLADRQDFDGAEALWEEVVRISPDSIDGKWAAETLAALRAPSATGAAASIATEGKVGFRIDNQTGLELHQLYVKPNNVSDRGEDVLGDFLLGRGESKVIGFKTLSRSCLWDLVARDATSLEIKCPDIDVCGEPTITLFYKNGTPTVTTSGGS